MKPKYRVMYIQNGLPFHESPVYDSLKEAESHAIDQQALWATRGRGDSMRHIVLMEVAIISSKPVTSFETVVIHADPADYDD